MSRKRTRSSKTTPENPIVIDEEVKERFDSIFKHQPMISEKGFNLKNNDLMVVPMPIRKTIIALNFMPISHSSTISMERMLLLYAILTEKSFNVGKIILKEIYDCAKKKTGHAYFPSLITSLCLRAHVKTQENLKGQYVQGCITSHDLEKLVEKVHDLNQGEQEEPTEPDIEESTNKTKNESVTATEEEKYDK
ncbi:hypothetical protein PVK06_040102 [Gossypium arboreum]|uniref:Putative plant transposon protein domain-containing protein n=1 Tax=Gossypium arboreum TaxID=29729 RepID=A0ABR0N4K6_GOSAR|nr:hypothetical protein PVK06_040102 [Gossypium arboreum]